MKLSDFDYYLPEELIAQNPIPGRSGSRMMVVSNNKIEHKKFTDFINYLCPDDVLVLNDTKVIPSRLLSKRKTGANVEIFLAKPLQNGLWEALIKNSRRIKVGEEIEISDKLTIKIIEKGDVCIIEPIFNGDFYEILNETGKIPLPPYISREAKEKDKDTYQTVYARNLGSVAAPTAGLHFTKEIIENIEKRGIKIAYITLVVGLGTFMPIKCENILEHKMHSEHFSITKNAAEIIKNAKRVVAVGTTVTRALEATYQKYGEIRPICDDTNIFIYPPYEFKVVDKLLTNFHLPKSTLIMLVSAFAGKENIFNAYKKAVNEKYRFFSYGDCMLLDKFTQN